MFTIKTVKKSNDWRTFAKAEKRYQILSDGKPLLNKRGVARTWGTREAAAKAMNKMTQPEPHLGAPTVDPMVTLPKRHLKGIFEALSAYVVDRAEARESELTSIHASRGLTDEEAHELNLIEDAFEALDLLGPYAENGSSMEHLVSFALDIAEETSLEVACRLVATQYGANCDDLLFMARLNA